MSFSTIVGKGSTTMSIGDQLTCVESEVKQINTMLSDSKKQNMEKIRNTLKDIKQIFSHLPPQRFVFSQGLFKQDKVYPDRKMRCGNKLDYLSDVIDGIELNAGSEFKKRA